MSTAPPVMALVFVGGIAILAIVAVGGAITAVRGQRWISAAFWVVASLFLLGWLYGIAGGLSSPSPVLHGRGPG